MHRCEIAGSYKRGVLLILPQSFADLIVRQIELRRPDGRSTPVEMDGFISFFTTEIGFSVKTDENMQAGTEVWLVDPEVGMVLG